jgi:arylsulfatase A-like enzyme
VHPTTDAKQFTSAPSTAQAVNLPRRPGALDLLVLAVWCGLAAGLLEVGARVLCRAINPLHRLYFMSRHFVWLTPLVNLSLFLCLGLCMAALTKVWPRVGGWVGPRLICTMAILPMLMVAGPRVFPEAWFILALGIASRLVPLFERRPDFVRRRLVQTLPVFLGVVLILAGTVFGGDWLKARREAARDQPPAGSPNVLLIVLDTVRADHLSLYGYERPTTPTLERLAKHGVRFDAARATAPWTLMSHASFFTGRWPHELDVEWLTPLRKNFPMLAEYLAAHGYATAGFVSNVEYCSYDTGLDRGFTYYEDYLLEKLSPLRTSVMVEEALNDLVFLGLRHDTGVLRAVDEYVRPLFQYAIRRDAESINRGFLSWLDRRPDSKRPFFVFLNYLDAHTPYKVPRNANHRFGRRPLTLLELRIIYGEWTKIDKRPLPRHYLTLARNCYDSCLAYLDEEIGRLCDDLERRGVLGNTWVVITSDHGEGLGEHDLFEHGESLYSTEIHVPLLLVPPFGTTAERVVRETVSLRDLPATVIDLAGLGKNSPFPGRSLSFLWGGSRARSVDDMDDVISELPSPNPSDPSHGWSPARRGALVSLAEGDLVYIRNEVDGSEELYDERDDPRELINRSRGDRMGPVLRRFRERVARIKKGTHGSDVEPSPHVTGSPESVRP